MPVGLLAKLVALLLFLLAAVGVFVGGQKFVSLLDKRERRPPPTVLRLPLDSVPTVAEPPPRRLPTRDNPSGIAVLEPGTSRSLAPSRPIALRPPTEPTPERPAPAPPPHRALAPQPRPAEPLADTATAALRPPDRPAATVPLPEPSAGPEAVLVELQIGRLVSRTVVAYRDGDEALVPLGAFFDLAEIRVGPSSDSVFEARLEPGGERFRLAVGRDSGSVGGRGFAVEGRQLLVRDGEWYLASGRLGTMLALTFDVNWPDLTVTVLNPDSLPVARRMRRDRMRALLAERLGAHPDTLLGPPRTKWDGLVFDYNVAFPISGALVGGSSYQFSMGGQVAGGGLEIGVRSLGTLDDGTAELAATWKGVWVDNRYVKQVTLGTGTLTGPRYTGVRGVAVTNSPYIRPSYVGQLDYFGRLEPGWQLEAYSGSQLVAFDSIGPSGDYAITLPVGYGENPVDFVAYGPYGQVRRFNQTYRVVSEQLPYRQFEYGVSAGECVTTLCNGALNADLHYGLSRRVTVRGGVEGYSRDGLSDLVHPYAVATGLVGNALTLEGEAVGNGWLRGAVRLEPSLNLRLAAGYTSFDDQVARPVIAPPGRRSQWIFDTFLRPVPSLASLYLQATAELDHGVDIDASRARVQASVQADGIRLYPYVRFEHLAPALGEASTERFVGLSAYTNGRPSWGRALSQLWFRGDLEAGGGAGVNLAAVSVARSFGPPFRIEAGAAWQRGTPGTTFRVSLASYLPSLQATTTAVAPTNAPAGAVQTLQGAVVYDRGQRRVTTNPNAALTRSGVSGRVFLDANADGIRQPDEPGVAGVRVLVGSYATRTDSLGRYHVWDIPAFEPVQVEVDTTTLENPLYVPAFTTASLQPPPNAYRQLDLPLVTGAVLEGHVELDGTPLPGVTLVLTNTGNGKTTSFGTFSDGTFYALGVKPGHYTLAVDPRDLSARRLTGAPLEITAQPDRPDQLSNLVVEVRSAR
jgi:hypothetical protein